MSKDLTILRQQKEMQLQSIADSRDSIQEIDREIEECEQAATREKELRKKGLER